MADLLDLTIAQIRAIQPIGKRTHYIAAVKEIAIRALERTQQAS